MSVSRFWLNRKLGVPTQATARSMLRNPIAPLPKFTSTEGESLEPFFTQFDSTISKFSYSDYDKLLLLKQQLSGRALILVDSLVEGSQSYDEAKDLLLTALASKPSRKFDLIKELSNMQLNYSTEPFQYISDMKKIIHSVNKLNMNANDFLQYFFWNGMNESFKNQLVMITSNTKPTVDEIMENFFAAEERYKLFQENFKARRRNSGSKDSVKNKYKSSVMSTEVSLSSDYSPFRFCSLCNTNSHAIYKCDKYVKTKEKLDRLKVIGACKRCANSSHNSSSCKYRFPRKCCKCERWHLSFLCSAYTADKGLSLRRRFNSEPKKGGGVATSGVVLTGANRSHRSGEEEEIGQATSGLVIASLYNDTTSLDAILSTFTCNLSDNRRVRCLLDSGSQTNFISERVLSELNHVVLKETINIQIKGINEVRNHVSRLVQVDLNISGVEKKVEFLTLPTSINLSLPGLGVIVRKFQSLGYRMADDPLSCDMDKIS